MLRDLFKKSTQNFYIIASAIYLLALLFFGKASAMSILFVYFLETLVVGFFNVLKIFCTISFGAKEKSNSGTARYGLILFFIIHYGFFVAIQSIFGFALFGIKDKSLIKEPFYLIENYGTILSLEEVKYALPAIIFSYLGKFLNDFLANKKYNYFTAKEILFSPYLRIFIQQFVVLISFFFIVFSDAGAIAAILLIVFRLLVDLFLESIKKDSKTLNYAAKKLANKNASEEDIKKQLLSFTE